MKRKVSGLSISAGGLTELKQRLLFVLLGIFIYRVGSHIPVPGLDPQRLAQLFNQNQNNILGLFNMFSGGALSRLTVFAIGIVPYISSSIIMQLLTVVLPQLEQLKKEGEIGRRKINQYTRYGTLILASFQSLGLAKWLVANNIVLQPGMAFYFVSVVTLVTGTMFLMWLGEQMTERGVGNGISLIIFAGIVSRFPAALGQMFEHVRQGQIQPIYLILLIAFVLAVVAFVVFVERAQRQITVNYAQRNQLRAGYAPQSTHLPLKINISGVIPPIFASSIIMLPATIANFLGGSKSAGWVSELGLMLSPGQPLHMLLYAIAIVGFAFFYTALVFNPKETADNLKKSGAFLPGIRPGEQTAKFIDGVMTRLTLVGAIYLVAVCLMPEMLMYKWHVPFYFGGTSLLIIVVVIMDFMAQVQAHLMSHQYESLMKKANLKNSGRSGMYPLR